MLVNVFFLFDYLGGGKKKHSASSSSSVQTKRDIFTPVQHRKKPEETAKGREFAGPELATLAAAQTSD